MKHLLLIILLCILSLPVMAQDATLEVTVEPMPVTVVDGGEGIDINIGGEVPVDETSEPSVEPMPWWAQAGLTIAGLATLYVTLTTVVRDAVKAFMARPSSVASAENAVNLIRSLLPDMLEEAAAKGARQAQEATRETVAELRRAFDELVDGIPAADKQRPNNTTTSSGGYTSTVPPQP